MSELQAKLFIQNVLIISMLTSIVLVSSVSITTNDINDKQWTQNCPPISPELHNEIAGYSKVLDAITQLVIDGPFKGQTYNFLAQFVDKFGTRLTGSDNLEQSIDYVLSAMDAAGLENVHGEEVTVPVWIRGKESLQMLRPRVQNMALMGLGTSIGTPLDGITAGIIIANSFDDLNKKCDQVPGKIVVFNQPYDSYGNKSVYRVQGAVAAARCNAVAVLVRSVTPSSIYSPHTGLSEYEDGVTKIPAACITVEDAEFFQRIVDRGQTVEVKLKMGAQNLPDGKSRNAVAELTGRSKPEEVVIVSGHLDSWDVGQGAMDDGGGAIISIFAPLVLQNLSLQPRRTIRTVLWTGEEFSYVGAKSYREAHKQEWDKINIVLESDLGTFEPKGLSFSGTNGAACILREIVRLVAPTLNATTVTTPDYGSDTVQFSAVGIPTASLIADGDIYFNFHHSNGDTMTVEDPNQLDKCLVFWTFISYVLADLSVQLPRNNSALLDGEDISNYV